MRYLLLILTLTTGTLAQPVSNADVMKAVKDLSGKVDDLQKQIESIRNSLEHSAAPANVELLASPRLSENTSLAAMASKIQRAVCEAVEDFKDCHNEYPAGCSPKENSRYDPYLAFLKNQLTAPGTAPAANKVYSTLASIQALEKKVPSALAQSNHADFATELAAAGEGSIATIVGYIYYAQYTSGGEASNCYVTGQRNSDFHIGIGFDDATAAKLRNGTAKTDTMEQQSVVVEATPHYRAKFHPSWTSATKFSNMAGRKVKIIGQLIYDNDHANANDNCGYPNADKNSCWRGSAWELHPVLRFFVCKNGDSCAANSPDSAWEEQ